MLEDKNIFYVCDEPDDAQLKVLIDNVCTWGFERNITAEGGATALSQTKKMAEELQEFIDAKTEKERIDALGDMFVVLIQMHRLAGYTLEHTLEAAWLEIKDRRGHMEKGVFIKDEG